MSKKTPHLTWPRLTPVQKDLLLEIDNTKHGDLCIRGAKYLRTVWKLAYEGLIYGSCGHWYSLTQRGKDYVRFSLRPARAKKVTPRLISKPAEASHAS